MKRFPMRLLPRTMFGQVALALFASLLVVQMVGLWLLLDDRGRLNYKLLAEYSAQRMAGIATVLDMAEPAERTALAHALSVQPTTLSLSQPWALDKTDASEDARNFAAEASRQLESPLDIQVLNLERIDPFLAEVHPPPLSHRDKDGLDGHRKSKLMARTYVAQIRLHDGTVVTFTSSSACSRYRFAIQAHRDACVAGHFHHRAIGVDGSPPHAPPCQFRAWRHRICEEPESPPDTGKRATEKFAKPQPRSMPCSGISDASWRLARRPFRRFPTICACR